jgi:hypothetical protein
MQLPFFDPDKIGVMNSLSDINNLIKGNLENQYYGPTQQADIA